MRENQNKEFGMYYSLRNTCAKAKINNLVCTITRKIHV